MTQTPCPASSAFASQDVIFLAALKKLPVLLKEAIMDAGLDDPTLLQSYQLASLLELGLDEKGILSMGSTVSGTAVSIFPIDVSASSSVSCPSPPLSLPISSSVSAPSSTHIHSQTLGKRARKKVHSITSKEDVVDHGVKGVSGVGELKGSAVRELQTRAKEKMKSGNEKTPLTSKVAVPVIRRTDDEVKSLRFPASSSSAQNSEFQSEDSSTAKAQRMGVRSEVGGSSKLSSHQMAVRSGVGESLRAELSSNASANELRTNPLQAWYSRATLLYRTLVRDRALPSGFQQEFESLVSAIETGAERALRQSAKRTDTDAVMNLHSLEQKRKETEQADKTAVDQFIQAASLKPRSFRHDT